MCASVTRIKRHDACTVHPGCCISPGACSGALPDRQLPRMRPLMLQQGTLIALNGFILIALIEVAELMSEHRRDTWLPTGSKART